MALTPHQKTILNLFQKEKRPMKKSEIVELVFISYYHGKDKYIGEILSRMVKNGLLVRVSNGMYALNITDKQMKLL